MAAAFSDGEQLLGGGKSGRVGPRRRRWMAILVITGVAGVAVALLAGRSVRTDLRLLARDSISLGQMHQTSFGTVPHILHVSGSLCPYGQLNGAYFYQGTTADGRAYYASGKHLLYYDRECNGEEGLKNDGYGGWRFSFKGHGFHADRKEMLSDGKCAKNAVLYMSEHPEKYNETKPYDDFSHRPGGVPPAVHAWAVWCGRDGGWTVQVLHVVSGVHVRGRWQFVRTATANENITLMHGKSRTDSDGGRWESHGSSSATLGGEEGPLVFGTQTGAPAEIGERLRQTWAVEVQFSGEREVHFALPKTGDQALWQWVLLARQDRREAMVLTQQYAFTASGTEPDRPKCYPGGSTDGYRYQECHQGWAVQ